MVDLATQYKSISADIDAAVLKCIASAQYINGPEVGAFQQQLEEYLDVEHVIPCANGTDALQIALMAMDVKPGDEVIVPAFTYVATAEVIALLGLQPVMVDVSEATFNITEDVIRSAITERTKAIVPVHLFGQSSPMDAVMKVAAEHDLFVIEDNAQAIGATYTSADGIAKRTGTIGHVGCLSFFPSKNLGCYGDGGAITTNNDDLAARARMIANHGQKKKYYHSVIGVNSRLDTLQAAILSVKLRKLDEYCAARQKVAAKYDAAFDSVPGMQTPERAADSTHVFHQYTLKIADGRRDALKDHLASKDIPSMIYYPVPLYRQDAFEHYVNEGFTLPVTEALCDSVLSLPIHTEMREDIQDYIIENVRAFFERPSAASV